VSRQIDRGLLISFLEEAMGYLPAIREGIEEYIVDYNTNSIQNAYRLIHTIKGTASMVGFADLSHVSYSIEEALEEIIDSLQPMSTDRAAFLLRTLDQIEERLNELSHDTLAPLPTSAAEEEMGDQRTAASGPPEMFSPPSALDAQARPLPDTSTRVSRRRNKVTKMTRQLIRKCSKSSQWRRKITCVSSAPGWRRSTATQMTANRFQEVRRSAHTLKGAAGVRRRAYDHAACAPHGRSAGSALRRQPESHS